MSEPVVWRWRRTDMKEGWAKWMYQETEPTRETLGNVMDIAEVEPLYAHPEDAPEIPMADQDELEDIARAEAAGTEDAPGGLN